MTFVKRRDGVFKYPTRLLWTDWIIDKKENRTVFRQKPGHFKFNTELWAENEPSGYGNFDFGCLVAGRPGLSDTPCFAPNEPFKAYALCTFNHRY